MGKEEIIETFFGSLPEDSFTPQESDLRIAVREVLHRANSPVSWTKVGRAPAVQNASWAALPYGVGLKLWCERRAADDFNTGTDNISLAGKEYEARRQKRPSTRYVHEASWKKMRVT